MSEEHTLVAPDELDEFEQSVDRYRRRDLDEAAFTARRLQQGVYGQRQDGYNMVRVKVPGGRLQPQQLEALAHVLENHSEADVANITTRQDIQFHFVPLAKTPEVLHLLGRHGLTTREACGNTVRNVTACPLAGVCPREHTDVRVFLDATVRHFLRHPLTQHMPRKFKISFSGCEADCAQGMIHDVGVVAVRKDGRFGFKLLAGGGLGHKPHEAVVVEPFIEERDLLPCLEAAIALHHRYSDRAKRAKSRLKFLVDRFGAQGFVEKYREERARTLAAFAGKPYPRGEWVQAQPGTPCGQGAPRRPMPQKQAGLYALPAAVPLGDLTAAQLRGLARLLREEGLTHLHATQDQNLVLLDVPAARLEPIRAGLKALGLGEPRAGDDVVTCPGTWTCRLGITSSRELARRLDGGAHDLRVRVSGCHSGCAQPYIGDIGLHGEGRRLHGKLIPHYRLHLGGDGQAGGRLGLKGPAVPAARVETALRRVKDAYHAERADSEGFVAWAHRRGADYFATLLADLAQVAPQDVHALLRDHGGTEPFRVLQLGGGECAGVAHETVAALLGEVAHERGYRNAFARQRMDEEAIECAQNMLRLTARGLLTVAGAAVTDDLAEATRRVGEALPEHAPLAQRLASLNAGLETLRAEFDPAGFERLAAAMDEWCAQADALCRRLEARPRPAARAPRPAPEVLDLPR